MPAFLVATIMPNQRVRRPQVWLFVAGTIVLVALFVFLNVGRWLVAEDPLRKAAAIAVLSGRMPERALEAARIYRQGFAPRIWLTYSAEPGATLTKHSVHFVGEEQYSKEVLVQEGVPESAIEILEPPIENTADEMRAIGNALARQRDRTVILVTSKVHTCRVHALWKRLAAQDGTAIVRGVSDDSFDSAHWWRHTRDALDVVREVLGLMNAWAGLPLQPSG
jgi:uncharacterized SAM-binding protein YcdF (DUF218 family)